MREVEVELSVIYLSKAQLNIRLFIVSLANNTNNFQRAEINFTKLCGLFEKLGFFSYVLYISMPTGLIIYAHITDSVTNETYLAPFNDL